MGCAAALSLLLSQKILDLDTAMGTVVEGMKEVIEPIIVLALAWALGGIIQATGTAMAQRIKGDGGISAAYFGDGGTSSDEGMRGRLRGPGRPSASVAACRWPARPCSINSRERKKPEREKNPEKQNKVRAACHRRAECQRIPASYSICAHVLSGHWRFGSQKHMRSQNHRGLRSLSLTPLARSPARAALLNPCKHDGVTHAARR